jgi:hypothetical protein
MWTREKLLPQGEDRFMEKMVHGVKMGPRRRYCPWVKMGAWMRLWKGWAHGKDIPQKKGWVEKKMSLEK